VRGAYKAEAEAAAGTKEQDFDEVVAGVYIRPTNVLYCMYASNYYPLGSIVYLNSYFSILQQLKNQEIEMSVSRYL
jgi:hypothetical protein